jgi:hypothetical protein
MPISSGALRKETLALIRQRHPPGTSKILDVGPGVGTYAKCLPEYTLDCDEIFEPYVEKYKLEEQYRTVFTHDVSNFPFLQYNYDLVIMGDVLEHITLARAQLTLDRIRKAGAEVVVVIPYRANRHGERPHGNRHEEHVQFLKPRYMKRLYPWLELIAAKRRKGLYLGRQEKYEL